MKATAAISIAALVAALAVTPGIALDVNVGVGANASASSDEGNANAGLDLGLGANLDAGDDNDDLGVDTAATGSIGTAATGSIGASASDDNLDIDTRLDLLLQLINESDYEETSFTAWADASSTTVINTNEIFDLDGQAKIDAAIAANVDEHDDLSAAIDANASLKAWLESNDIDADSIIAIDVSADGSVEVYEG